MKKLLGLFLIISILVIVSIGVYAADDKSATVSNSDVTISKNSAVATSSMSYVGLGEVPQQTIDIAQLLANLNIPVIK